jgi:hypothetical protein
VTTVNWDQPGEKVEEFVAALLLLRYSHGNSPTPARGDRGVDVRVWNPDGYDIYQVKRYRAPLTSGQAKRVEQSWEKFVNETLPVLPVRSWTLVTPWEPTNPRLDWLEELTAGRGIRTGWMGGRALDGLIADNPALVEYFFGDGGERLHRLMAEVLRGGRDLPQGVPVEDLLQAVIDRQRGLATALNEVDPFYRYEVQLRLGRVSEQAWDADLLASSPVAWLHYRQVDENSYLVLRLLPRCAESTRLRPITASVELEAPQGSPEQQAIEDWLRHGAPFDDVPGTVTGVTGPPSALTSGGPGHLSFMTPKESGSELPDLEIRLLNPQEQVVHTLDLIDVRTSRGVEGPGLWLSGTDRSGVLQLGFLLNGAEHERVRMTMASLVGNAPADVLPAVRLVAGLADDVGLVLAVRGGRPLAGFEHPDDPELHASPMVNMARWTVGYLEVLLLVQQHTFQRVSVPDLAQMTPQQIAELMRLGRLLRGEEIRDTWTQVEMTRGASAQSVTAGPEFSMVTTSEIRLKLAGREIELDDVRRRVIYHSARIASPQDFTTAQPGDTIHLVPASSTEATIAIVPTPPEPPQASGP